MKNVAAASAGLEVRTIFNLLGPLTNPCRCPGPNCWGVCRRIDGVAGAGPAGPGSRRAMVVHGRDGMDEITTTTTTRITELRDGRLRTYEFDPRYLSANTLNFPHTAGAPTQMPGF